MGKNDDKTEKPTPKRKKEARRKGQVARSPDVSAWMIMLAGSLVVPTLFRAAEGKLTSLMNQGADVMTNPTIPGAMKVFESGLKDALALILPVVVIFAVIGVAASIAQTGLAVSLHGAAPKWERLNPAKGIKRLFSAQSVWQLGKQAVKLTVLVAVSFGTLKGLGTTLVGSQPVDMGPVITFAGSKILGLVRDISAVGLLLAFGDYAYQRHQLQKSLKMSKQEVKDEAKNSDGDPLVKGQIRRKMMRMSRSRMMAAVANADLVIVNPTHYAVALKYEPGNGRAPMVVAKGVDELARRIRDEGRKHKVPVVEDPPVARAIYAACEIDEQIPTEMYVAVARLLAFVFTLPAIVRSAGAVHRRRTSAMVA